MNARISFGLTCLIAVAGVAACGNGDGPIARPILGCNMPAVPTVVYPLPSATGVPNGGFALVLSFATGGTLSIASGQTTVQNNLTSAAVPRPLPSPHASTPPGDPLAAYGVGGLKASTTYQIVETFAASGPCPSVAIGSFTTK